LGLLQSGLAKTFEEFLHRPGRKGDVTLDPGNRNLGKQFLQSRERRASLVDKARLGQAHDVNSMTIGQLEALLNGLIFTAKAGGFRVAARDVRRETEGRIEQRILRIVTAPPARPADRGAGLRGRRQPKASVKMAEPIPPLLARRPPSQNSRRRRGGLRGWGSPHGNLRGRVIEKMTLFSRR
jgi:hypothetical protein